MTQNLAESRQLERPKRRTSAERLENPVTSFSNGVTTGEAAATMFEAPPASGGDGAGTSATGVSPDDAGPITLPTGNATLQEAADLMLVSAPDDTSNSPVTTQQEPAEENAGEQDDRPVDVGDAEAQAGNNDQDDQQEGSDDEEFDIEAALLPDPDGQGSDDDVSEEGPLDISAIPPETQLRITVDGETEDVTLAELVQSYNGDRAIDKRIQETAEIRSRTDKLFQDANQVVEHAVSLFQTELFSLQTEAPSAELATSNPAEYQRLDALHKAEVEAINGRKTQLANALQAAQQQQAEVMQSRRTQAAQDLHVLLPVLRDPTKGPQMKQAIMDTAKAVGYTDQDIAACTDPALFYLAALAAPTIRRMNAAKVRKQGAKRRERPAKQAPKTTASSAGKRKDQQNAQHAKSTGRWQDVAESIIVTGQ